MSEGEAATTTTALPVELAEEAVVFSTTVERFGLVVISEARLTFEGLKLKTTLPKATLLLPALTMILKAELGGSVPWEGLKAIV